MNNVYSLGIFLKLLNLILLTAYSLLLVSLGEGYPITQLCFVITSIGSLLCICLMILRNVAFRIQREDFLYCIVRALLNVLGIVTWIFALRYIGSNDATAISYIIPIITTILAYVILKEKFNIHCAVAIVIGIIGMLIVLRPTFQMEPIGSLSAIFSSICWSFYDLYCKKQTQKINYLQQALYNFVLSALLLMPFAIYNWQSMTAIHIFKISSISVLSTTNVIVLFLSYKFAPLTVLMPFAYLRLFLIAGATYYFFDEVITYNTVIGAVLISAATGWIFFQQRRGKIIV